MNRGIVVIPYTLPIQLFSVPPLNNLVLTREEVAGETQTLEQQFTDYHQEAKGC